MTNGQLHPDAIVVNGKRSDFGLHAEMLGNAEANAYSTQLAIDRALGRGMSLEDAQHIYGEPSEALSDPSLEDVA